MNGRWVGLLVVGGLAWGCRTAHETPNDAAVVTPSPDAVLAAMDARTPVPLLPMMANHQKQNMRDHLLAVQEITAGIAANDFSAIDESAGRIGFSEQMGAMCKHMGAGVPGFTDRALAFHHTADGISGAAKRRDMDAVVVKLNETLAACTSCHAMYKQQVVDDAAWAALSHGR